MMTGKELKDWCKTCSVEPPAMKFKCSECEHNPDKEQIIIHGCKVEECVNYRDEVGIGSIVLKNACSIGLWQRHYKNLEESCKMSCKCEENPNCYFKQLARKTQECDTLKSQLDFEVQQKECIEQECEKLKETLNKLTRGVVMPVSEPEVIDLTTRYRKALEEIESIAIKNQRENFYYDGMNELIEITIKLTSDYTLILDIINKAKGGKDE